MERLIDIVKEIPREQWDYYNGINAGDTILNPFSDLNFAHAEFIKKYFKRGGKVEVLKSTGIQVKDLRLPNHINSVFFLGILFYYRTDLHKNYQLDDNDPGYSTFPFIWFLIALFHDNAYQMELGNELDAINSLDELIAYFEIDHFLLDKKSRTKCKNMHDVRKDYFTYRKAEWHVVDHGILGGILLYDRLVKIRREKKQHNEDNLFWGENLEHQYLLAANAISLHNIYLPEKGKEQVYEEYQLQKLLHFKKVKFKDFPLFYLLGVIDTIEPLKTYRDCGFTDAYIFENLYFEFRPAGVVVSYNKKSKLDFNMLVAKTKNFKGWLNIKVIVTASSFELIFK